MCHRILWQPAPPVYKGRRKDTKDYALEPVPKGLWFQRRQADHCQVKQRPNSKNKSVALDVERKGAVLMWRKTLHLHAQITRTSPVTSSPLILTSGPSYAHTHTH